MYDNQDLCEMFGKSKRSLQRYRSEGSLPYVMIKNAAHYKESHVESFKQVIAEEFAQQNEEQDVANTTLQHQKISQLQSHSAAENSPQTSAENQRVVTARVSTPSQSKAVKL